MGVSGTECFKHAGAEDASVRSRQEVSSRANGRGKKRSVTLKDPREVLSAERDEFGGLTVDERGEQSFRLGGGEKIKAGTTGRIDSHKLGRNYLVVGARGKRGGGTFGELAPWEGGWAHRLSAAPDRGEAEERFQRCYPRQGLERATYGGLCYGRSDAGPPTKAIFRMRWLREAG